MTSSGEVFTGGATTSQHVEAENEDHFENTTFKLKRTRSMGLLDEFIQPTTAIDEQSAGLSAPPPEAPVSPSNAVVEKTKNLTLDTSTDNESTSTTAAESEDPIHIKSPEMIPHDDSDIQAEPKLHVDYLSHKWDVFDISKSWRYVIQKRRDVADSARLENASWRTWAQRRSNLKTISPEAVNWSKESDVTWLYGPILKDDTPDEDECELDSHKRLTTATSAVAGDISLPSATTKKGPKPILKHRTVQQLIISHSNLLKLQLATQRLNQQRERQELEQHRARQQQIQQQEQEQQYQQEISQSTFQKGHLRKSLENEPPEFDDYDAISAKLNSQYTNSRNNLNVSLKSMGSSPKRELLRDNPLLLGKKINPINEESENNETLQNIIQSTGTSNENKDFTNNNSNNNSNNNNNNNTNINNIDFNNNTNDNNNNNNNNNNSNDDIVIDDSNESNNNGSGLSGTLMSESTSSESSKENRHIHFNDEVQQCIAVDEYTDDEMEDYYDDSDDYAYDEGEDYVYEERMENRLPVDIEEDSEEDEDDEDGGFFLKVRSPSSASLSGGGGLPGFTVPMLVSSAPPSTSTEDTASISTTNSRRTIQMLPSTTLNHGSSDEESDEENPYTSSLSHYVNNDSSRGYDYHYDYNTVYKVDSNHAIYGTPKQSSTVDTPDMIDIPENITLGSNFDYEQIKDQSLPIIDPMVINSISKSPITEKSGGAFNMFENDSDSGSDSDDGLSIETKNSSHSLAQLVFGGMTGGTATSGFTPPVTAEAIPISNKTGSNNDGGISKQSTSSNSLSEQFFGSGFTKLKGSTSALSDQFFNFKNISEEPVQQVLPSVPQRKASPLPPHTTSANAFLGNTTPPQQIPANNNRNTFSFDSESDSEDEFVEDIAVENNSSGNTKSYATLSQVAGVNGIRSTSPELQNPNPNNTTNATGGKFGQAKGLANQLLGSWKGNNE